MKLLLFTTVCVCLLTNALGQSITLESGTFQLPRVATNPACVVADKGKVVFNTRQNKILYCNGSAWIDPEGGSTARVTPAFSVRNTSGQIVKSDVEVIEFPNEEFDLNNNFNLNNAETLANTFVAPDNGIYEFVLNAKMDLSNFVPIAGTRIRIGLAWSQTGSTSILYYEFPVYNDSDQNLIQVSKVLNVAAGKRVYFLVSLLNAPTYGVLRMSEIYLSGKLVSWY